MNNILTTSKTCPPLDSKNRHRVKTCLCGKSNKDGKFVPCVGFKDKGYCHSCGQSFLPDCPNQSFYHRPNFLVRPHQPNKAPNCYIPFDLFKKSLEKSALLPENNLARFLMYRFGEKIVTELKARFFISTSTLWDGAVIFWQIDQDGNIRRGKIMLYSPVTGRRVKEPRNCISSVHYLLKMADLKPEACLFGLHQLSSDSGDKVIGIVESEKSAIIATAYLPGYIWMATGSKSILKAEILKPLQGRKICLFPDLGCYADWKTKVDEIAKAIKTPLAVSDLLERKASDSDRAKGFDIADYLLKCDINEFKPRETVPAEHLIIPLLPGKVNSLNTDNHRDQLSKSKPPLILNWDNKISELEKYFDSVLLPNVKVQLDPATTINSIPGFLESHFATVKRNNGSPTFLPHLNRLIKLKGILQ